MNRTRRKNEIRIIDGEQVHELEWDISGDNRVCTVDGEQVHELAWSDEGPVAQSANEAEISAWNVIHGYEQPAPQAVKLLVAKVPINFDLEDDRYTHALTPRRVGAGSIAGTVLCVLALIAVCALAVLNRR